MFEKTKNVLACSFIMIGVVACSTPDFTPFAKNTDSLNTLIKQEHSAVSKYMSEQLKIHALECGNDQEKLMMDYNKTAKNIEKVLDTTVNYSVVLTDIVKAGDEGATAVASLYNSISSVAPLLSLPPGQTLAAISDALERVKAQKTLKNAVLAAQGTETLPGPIPSIATALDAMFNSVDGTHLNFAVKIKDRQNCLDKEIAEFSKDRDVYNGFKKYNVIKNVIKIPDGEVVKIEIPLIDHVSEIYQNVAGGSNILEQKHCYYADDNSTNSLRYSNENTRDNKKYCLPKRDIDLAVLILSIKKGKIVEEQFNSNMAVSKEFNEQRFATSKKIEKAIETWRKAHKKIAKTLKDCGDLKSLKNNCDNLTFLDFTLAVDKLKNKNL